MTLAESNATVNSQVHRIILSSPQPASDRTGLFIALFLLFLLFILISYLFYSFFSFKRFSSRRNTTPHNLTNQNLNDKIIFDENQDLINNKGDIVLARQSSFSDCGTSLRSSSVRSHVYSRPKRSSSYKYCSQTSNYLLTPCLSSQLPGNGDDSMPTTIIVEPNDIHLANALSRSISKYYERKRKPILTRRTHSCEDLTQEFINKGKNPLQITSSLPMRRGSRQTDRNSHLLHQRRTSSKKKPTTIYELYKSDRMRISNLLVSDT